MSMVVRTDGPPSSSASIVQSVIRTIDRDQPIADVRSMEQLIGRTLSQRRFTTLLLSLFALIAIATAAAGLFGVITYSVAQRSVEIAVRAALGASRIRIAGLVLGEALLPTAIGLSLGLLLARSLASGAARIFDQPIETDAVVIAAVTAVLGAVAISASLSSVVRALRIRPSEALKRG
jgi:putative ABC transport system permease protein